jgi:hypothetical protein
MTFCAVEAKMEPLGECRGYLVSGKGQIGKPLTV